MPATTTATPRAALQHPPKPISDHAREQAWVTRLWDAFSDTAAKNWSDTDAMRAVIRSWPHACSDAQRTMQTILKLVPCPKDPPTFRAFIEKIVPLSGTSTPEVWSAAYDAARVLTAEKTRFLTNEGAFAFFSIKDGIGEFGKNPVRIFTELGKSRSPLEFARVLNAAGALMASGRTRVAHQLLRYAATKESAVGAGEILRFIVDRSATPASILPNEWLNKNRSEPLASNLRRLGFMEDGVKLLDELFGAAKLSDVVPRDPSTGADRFKRAVVAAIDNTDFELVSGIVKDAALSSNRLRARLVVETIDALARGEKRDDVMVRHRWAKSLDVGLNDTPRDGRLTRVHSDWDGALRSIIRDNGLDDSRDGQRVAFVGRTLLLLAEQCPAPSSIKYFQSLMASGLSNPFDTGACSLARALRLSDRVDKQMWPKESDVAEHFILRLAIERSPNTRVEDWIEGVLENEAWADWSDRDFAAIAVALCRIVAPSAETADRLITLLEPDRIVSNEPTAVASWSRLRDELRIAAGIDGVLEADAVKGKAPSPVLREHLDTAGSRVEQDARQRAVVLFGLLARSAAEEREIERLKPVDLGSVVRPLPHGTSDVERPARIYIDEKVPDAFVPDDARRHSLRHRVRIFRSRYRKEEPK